MICLVRKSTCLYRMFLKLSFELCVLQDMASDNGSAKRLHTPEGTPPSHRTLTSPGHSSAILTTLRQLYRGELLCDYTVIAEGQSFKTHRTVLAAVSDYFRAMLTGRASTSYIPVHTQNGIKSFTG